MKSIFLFSLTLIIGLNIQAQAQTKTTTTTDGNWSVPSNWDNGVPANSDTAVVVNNMTLDQNITVDNSEIIINGPITDSNGGAAFDIEIKNGSYINVNENVKIEGNFTINTLSYFRLRSGDTLAVGGDVNIQSAVLFRIDSGGVFIINGDFTAKNFTAGLINGTVHVRGFASFDNFSVGGGSGSFYSDSATTIQNGSMIFGQTSGCPSGCFFGGGAGLPIILESFTAELSPIQKHFAELKWTTRAEINNNYFTLEYSTDGVDFNVVDRIEGAGNSNKPINYKVDVPLEKASHHYFRLTQTDFDGQSEQFEPIVLKTLSRNRLVNQEAFSVYPNPTNGEKLTLTIDNMQEGNYRLMILSSNGSMVMNRELVVGAENALSLNLDQMVELSKGIYLLRMLGNNGNTYSQTLIVQ